jgi:hypothetical protein
MRQIARILAIVLGMLWIGCEDEITVYDQVPQDAVFRMEALSEPAGVVRYDASGVLKVFEPSPSLGLESEIAGDYPLTLIASITPPYRESGELFTASHVDVSGKYAYVAYNTAGPVYEGAIDVVNISDANNPYVSSRLIFRNADVNAVVYQGGYLYAVGGVDAESSASAVSNSYLARIPVGGGNLDADRILYKFQQGFNATGVVARPDRILVSSGKEGSITAYRRSNLNVMAEIFMADARHLANSQTGIAVLDAGNGVRLMDPNLNETGMVPIETDLGETTKRTLDTWNQWIIVAEAAKGAGIYNSSSGALVQYLPIPLHPDGVDDGFIVTNAVSVNENAIFMANGGAGLSFAEREGTGARTVGLIELGGSVNYVVSQDDFAFAASGDDGLHVIKLNRPPDSLDTRYLDIPPYEGLSRMRVAKGESAAFRGGKRLENINVGGTLFLAGSWTVYNNVAVEPEGSLFLEGVMAVGRNDRRQDVVVEENALLQIEGDITIYGDLILREGARLVFPGDHSSIDVFGKVVYEGRASIEGNFRDVRSAF